MTHAWRHFPMARYCTFPTLPPDLPPFPLFFLLKAPPMQTIVLGSHNANKKREMGILLAPCGIQVLSLHDIPDSIEVEETGTTFGENARLKASEQAKHLGMWVVGEDSGLEVDALNGQPGVYSARYSDPGATDDRNNQKLLEELKGLPPEKRMAHYVCHIALSNPAGEIVFEVEEYCRGRIRTKLSGSHGFGYDPLFEIVEYHQTFGELSDLVKACISHRARATRQFREQIGRFLVSENGKGGTTAGEGELPLG